MSRKSPAQLDREIAQALTKAPEGFKIGDVVQFRSEPGTGGVIRSLASGEASVMTPRGARSIPTHALSHVPKAHVDRVRRASESSAHATMKTDGTSSTKEKLQQAAKWIRRELTKRADGSHPSHLARKVLEEADKKFALNSYGVEGWANSPSVGFEYLNYGDPYDSTIVVRSNPTRATVHVALGGWASYAPGGG